MPDYPTGTVTFLFTDIEGSTTLWEQHPTAMQRALERHDILLRGAVEANGGYVFKTVGDAFCAAFPTAVDALSSALTAQRALESEDWASLFSAPGAVLRIRIAMHTGIAQERDGDYFGASLNRVARLLAAANGGQTLLTLPTHELVRDHLPTGVRLDDLGEHRLKDLLRPERIFQVVTGGLQEHFAPLRTLDSRPNNLPEQLTPFIGRDREIEALHKLLLGRSSRLITLTGPGGTGKTRLALQVGADLVDEFEHGVWFVNLAPIVDPSLVPSEIAQALAVRESGGQPLAQILKDTLRDKHLLLILDNFEQIAGAATLVADLLRAAHGLRVLVTSRVPLNVTGEQEYPVPSLSLPDKKHLPPVEALSQYEAVALFIQRAQQVKPDFVVTNENAPAVAEICARLDGLPLAIELAAARIRLLPPQAMLARLESRLKLLTGGARDVPVRQQTLRNAIEWSYDLLSQDEKQLFRRLAVFVGGRTLEAIEAVCGGAIGNQGSGHDNGEHPTPDLRPLTLLQIDVLDGVESLISKSLLRQLEGSGGMPRFVMLETIHEYAHDKLEESGEADELRKRHAAYFVALAEEAEPELYGFRQVEWLDRLEDEHDNFRVALRWLNSQSASEAQEMHVRMAAALRRFWQRHDHFGEALEILSAALSKDAAQEKNVARAKLLTGLANFHTLYTGEFERARQYAQESAEICRTVGDDEILYNALTILGHTVGLQGEMSEARVLREECLVAARRTGHMSFIGTALRNLAYHTLVDGDTATARLQYEESLQLLRAAGDVRNIAMAALALGELARDQGDYATAGRWYEEALSMFQQTRTLSTTCLVLAALGIVAQHNGDHTRAAAMFKQALAQMRAGMPLAAGDDAVFMALTGLGAVATSLGNAPKAVRLFAAAEARLHAVVERLDPVDRREHDRYLTEARAQLTPEQWEQAWAEGQAMSLDHAIAYAQEDMPAPDGLSG